MSKFLCSKTSVETRPPKQTKGSKQTSMLSTRKGVIMTMKKATIGASHSLLNVAPLHSSCLMYRYEEWITLHGRSTHSCLIRLVEWSAGWSVGRSVGSLVDWLKDSLVGWLVGWLVSWLVGWLVGWLVCWLVGWFVRSLFGARISFCDNGNRADLENVRISSELTRLVVRQD